jgi:zinc transporter ZupT
VPHEIGDFAILLRAGFSRWDAAKAQLMTGMAGVVGSLTAVAFSGAGTSMGTYIPLTRPCKFDKSLSVVIFITFYYQIQNFILVVLGDCVWFNFIFFNTTKLLVYLITIILY